MDYNSELLVKKIIWLFTVLLSLFIILLRIYNPWNLVLISGFLLLSFTIRGMKYPLVFRFYKLIAFLEVILIMGLQMNDQSGYSRVYCYILIADGAISYSYVFNACIAVLCIITNFIYLGISYGNLYTKSFYNRAAGDSFMLIVFLSIMCLVKYEIGQRKKISKMMQELKIKSKQLEDTNLKLCDNATNLEEITILKERNRIAREIHDTFGHTLTSVLMELEAGERLLRLEKEAAAEKIGLAKGQVRKGLTDIRESVGILNRGKAVVDFTASLKLLLEETKNYGGIHIRYEIKELPPLTETQEKALFRALQEGLTNGIKHGSSSAFIFLLNYDGNKVTFHLQDNGTGCEKIVYGFGLSAMEQRIRETGGKLCVTSALQEGFCIDITLPLRKEESLDED
ncbi:sensor histidine kinase [Anaerocolumna sp. AGMB13025]|uniref:sensor histidine kinase n=1 Tax=Anaerocolumna sp. AGMB13025 TaxID=3039116 RepID=UPI00241D0BA7|nr:sensor histidine kinase [Anaerocolumna sp. AGMB13025]WFR58049.1 sensor histidine kinase [Anaerocolumna sp. AGMB13025]